MRYEIACLPPSLIVEAVRVTVFQSLGVKIDIFSESVRWVVE